MRAHAADAAAYDTHLRHGAPFERIRCVLSCSRPSRLCFSRRSRRRSRGRLQFYRRDPPAFYPVAASSTPSSPPRVSPKGSSRDDEISRSCGRKGRDDDIVACARETLSSTWRADFSLAELARRRERQTEGERERNQRSTIIRLHGWFALRRLSCVLPSILRRAYIGAPYPREYSFSRRFYYEKVSCAPRPIESRIV